MQKGIFITVEGGEGAGKTTVIDHMEEALRKAGFAVLRTREPGGVKLAEQIRDILLHTEDVEMDDRTEALLYAAARREHLVKKVLPALQSGQIVLCDRFIDSSLVYQGYARGIGIEAVRKVNEFAIEDHMPDLTLYFQVEPEVGLARVQIDKERNWNRLDQEALAFHKEVENGYNLIINQSSDRIKVINANQSFENVYHEAYHVVSTYIQSKREWKK